MKFNARLTASEKEYLEKQYREYTRKTPMTDKEKTALKEWVMDGNSPYDNPAGFWKDGFHPADFLDVYRDEEYINDHTRGMAVEDRNRFAAEYYGFTVQENDN